MDDFVFSHSVLDQKQTMQIKYLYIIIYNLFEKGFPPFNDLSKEFKFETKIFILNISAKHQAVMVINSAQFFSNNSTYLPIRLIFSMQKC